MAETSSTAASGGGIGFCGLLAVAFIVLKLCNVITWSWWWVLAPLWGPVALLLGIAAIAFIIYLGLSAFGRR